MSQLPVPDDPHALDRQQIRNEMQIAIAAVQTTIEKTNEDDTRIRMKTTLKTLQRLQLHLEAHFKLED